MRCKGGNGYYEYVRMILESKALSPKNHKTISDYKLKVFDELSDMIDCLNVLNVEKDGLCKVVAGPGWSQDEDIVIQDNIYHWVGSTKKENRFIYSIHKTQGFDLNYAGVIFGHEIYYDEETKQLAVNKKYLKDNRMKSSGDEKMREYLLDIYLTLMTRGIYGTYVYAMDTNLSKYLKEFFE